MDTIDFLTEGAETYEEYVEGFQELINSGMAWRLEGSIGRDAMRLIESGQCILGEQSYRDAYGNHVPSRYEVKAGTKGSIEYMEAMQDD